MKTKPAQQPIVEHSWEQQAGSRGGSTEEEENIDRMEEE